MLYKGVKGLHREDYREVIRKEQKAINIMVTKTILVSDTGSIHGI